MDQTTIAAIERHVVFMNFLALFAAFSGRDT
jgi:hypothetical protein